ncbi:MAG: DMT family transporter, partial [Eubacteriales bacterium]|nr:DMT family transporter [Eubacteriales bacterium]
SIRTVQKRKGMSPKCFPTSAQVRSMTFWRFLISSALLLPAALSSVRKRKIHLSGKNILAFSCQGVLCVCLSMVALQLAVFQAKSAAMIAVIFSTNSVLSVLLAAVLLKEPMTLRKVLAVVLCMAGVVMGSVSGEHESLSAIALALCAAASMSLFTVLGKKLMKGIPPEVQIGVSFPIGAAVLALFLLIARVPLLPTSWDVQTLGIIGVLGIVVTGLGYWSYFKAMECSGASMAAMVFFIKPIFAPVASMIFLGNVTLDATFYLSLSLVTIGSSLLLWHRKQRT